MICTKSYLKRLHSRYQISNNTIPNNSMSESFIVIVPTTQKRYVFEKHIVFECSKQLKFMFFKKATKFCEIFPFTFQYIQSKVRGRFRKIFWPSLNVWSLITKETNFGLQVIVLLKIVYQYIWSIMSIFEAIWFSGTSSCRPLFKWNCYLF